MATAGSIVVDLLMRTGSFETDTKRAEDMAKQRAKAIDEAFTKMGTAIGVAAGTAGGALVLMVKNTTEAAAAITKMAQVANAPTQQFQQWAAASQTVGIEQEKLSDILKDVNDKVGEFLATGGGPLKDFFEKVAPKVGLTAEAFKDLSGPQALQLYTSSLEAAGLEQKEMTFYMEALASDATALIPLLRNGGEEMKLLGDRAQKTGQVLSGETILAAKELDRQVSQLMGTLKGASNAIVSEVLPVLNVLAKQANEAAQDVGVLTSAGDVVATTLEAISVLGVNVAYVFKAMGTEIGGIAAQLVALATLDFDGFSSIGEAMRKDAKAAREEVDRLSYSIVNARRLTSNAGQGRSGGSFADPRVLGVTPEEETIRDGEYFPSGAPGGRAGGGGSGGGGGRAGGQSAPDWLKEYERQMERAKDLVRSFESEAAGLTRSQTALADIMANPAWDKFSASMRDALTSTYKQAEAAEELEKRRQKSLDDTKAYQALVKELQTDEERNAATLKERLELIARIADLSDEQRKSAVGRAIGASTSEAPEFGGLAPEVGGAFGELQKIDAAEEKLQEWYQKQLDMLAEFRQSRADMSAEWDAEEENLAKQREDRLLEIDQARQMAQMSAAESTFGSLADMAKTFAGEQSDVYRTLFAIQKAAAIANSIIAIQQGIAMAAANPWPLNLAAMASVAAATASIVANISSVGLNARATGGPVSDGKPYLVGEMGPELFVPNTNGAIVPHNRLGGGGNVTVNLIEDKRRAGTTEQRDNNGEREIDVFVADIMGDGTRSRALQQAFGLRRRGT